MQKFDVNSLKVAKPCPMGWENMNGDDRVRFCRLCELNVYNISEMTSVQVRSLVENSGGRICGRIYKRADGTVLTRDCPVGLNKYRKRAAKYFGTVLGMVLGLFSVTFGQSDEEKAKASEGGAQVRAWRTIVIDQQSSIKGTVIDMNGAVVSGVTVSLINGKKTEITVKTDDNGEYKASSLPAGIYLIRYEAGGFLTYEVKKFAVEKNEAFKVDVKLKYSAMTVIVGMIGGDPLIDTSSSTIVNRIILD